MARIFPIVRAALLVFVAACTLIVLGIAIHFQMSFISSPELTFVPLAVFAAASTLAVFVLLCAAPCINRLKPIAQTRWELLWVGILAVLWLAVAGITAQPETADYEVECWSEEDGVVVEDDVDGYSNEVYHARYRVLQAFAFLIAILLLGLFLFMLTLAIWHHKRGRWVIWTTPTTMVGWFDKGTAGKGLPPPVTDKRRGRSREHTKYKALNEKDGSKYTHIPAVTRKDTHRRDRYGSDEALLPKEFTKSKDVWVPPTKEKDNSHPPIAKKMLQTRNAPPVHAPAPARRASDRQTADVARNESRRDRRNDDDDAPRPTRNQSSSRRPIAPAVARPADLRRGDTNGATRPSAARQASAPAVVRPEGRRQGSSQAQPARPAVARQRSALPPGRI